ncbi:MAG TPA: ABC transporter permease [Bryobacteraceae bacterium]|jgi:predicted permease|nr:ABC transporter permease [Bryobacteraceae bacterium]
MNFPLEDVKHSFRALLQNPGFTIAALAALSLGIGANTAIFSVVNTVLLKPLAAPDADRIVQFENTTAGVSYSAASPRNFNVWREQTTQFQDVSAHWLDHLNLTGGPNPELIPAARVTVDFFHLYGAPVLYGRTFTPDEGRPKGGNVVVLGHDLWIQRFGADPRIVGRTISLSDAPYVVVGILGPNFSTEQFDKNPDVWIPFQIEPGNPTSDGRLCIVTGRLKPGATIETARADLQRVADEYRRAFPAAIGPTGGFTIQKLRDAMVGDIRPALLVLVGAVGFVLLIACANVASLLLARAVTRQREIAIRAAVGASRGRIIRQMLTESVALSLIGGGLGAALGTAGIRAFLAIYPTTPLGVALNPVNIPRIGQAGSAVALDWRIFSFTILLSVITGMVFGLIPALQASSTDLSAALKESSGRSGTGFRQSKTRSILVITEMALALVLLIGAALLIRTSIALRSVKPGFDSYNVLTMQMSLAGARVEQARGMDRLIRGGIERIDSLPGVEAAATSCCLPLETVWQLSFIVQGRPLNGRIHGVAGWTFISPGYFDALKIPVLRGRAFTGRDDATQPGVVIINQEMARRVWPNSDPLNDRLLVGRAFGPEYDQDPVRQIVGIVGDVRDVGLNQNPRPAMYVPIAQLPEGVNSLVLPILPIAWIVRTRVPPESLSMAIQNELRQASGGLPVARVRSMDEVAAQSTARSRFNMLLMSIFGGSALLLAATGIYGLMAYSVQQRMQEIGIRIALGAATSDVRSMVISQGMRLALIGAGIGIVLAFGMARFIASFLFGVKAWDPIVFITVPILLSTVALFAVWLPALRASRIDPIDALRHE